MLTIQFLCPLPNGLHARPAWELKEQCSQWQSEITFINHRQNAKADAKSSLALIGTGTLFNDSCSLNISGSDEEQARRVLEEYIQARLPTARKVSGCSVPKCSIWIATARRTSRSNLKPTSRCYWRRATSRLSSARWTSAAIKAFLI